jgi:hypothetical protein
VWLEVSPVWPPVLVPPAPPLFPGLLLLLSEQPNESAPNKMELKTKPKTELFIVYFPSKRRMRLLAPLSCRVVVRPARSWRKDPRLTPPSAVKASAFVKLSRRYRDSFRPAKLLHRVWRMATLFTFAARGTRPQSPHSRKRR